MKILLQHTRTLQYLRADGSWTRHASEARNFFHSEKAIEFAYENNLADVYIAVKFRGSDSRDDVAVALPAMRPPALFAAHNVSAQARA